MIFAVVMILATLALATSAGFLSVVGFAKTFESTYWQAAALAASLEVGKLVAASFLYRYWSSVSRIMRTGMVAAVVGLMLFTSAGIYSYLSASYQTSSVSLNVNTQRVDMLEQERERSISRKAEIDAQIANLPANYVRSRRQLQQSFGDEQHRLDLRIGEIDSELLTLKQQTIENESHVGPVIFVARTLGMDSDTAVSWFILLVVMVFDPLAVMMTLGTNHVLMYRLKGVDHVMNVAHDANLTHADDDVVDLPTSVPPYTQPTDDSDRLKAIEGMLTQVIENTNASTLREEHRRHLQLGVQPQ